MADDEDHTAREAFRAQFPPLKIGDEGLILPELPWSLSWMRAAKSLGRTEAERIVDEEQIAREKFLARHPLVTTDEWIWLRDTRQRERVESNGESERIVHLELAVREIQTILADMSSVANVYYYDLMDKLEAALLQNPKSGPQEGPQRHSSDKRDPHDHQ